LSLLSAAHAAVLLVLPTLISCASSAGRQVGRLPGPKVDGLVVTTSNGSWQIVRLDSARVDSLRQAGVILAENVDERPEIVSGPQLEYPLSARQERITGRVVIQAIIDRDGHAEPLSLGVRRSVDWRLDRAALDYMEQASFKPGRVHGEIVRTLVDIPVEFIIRGKY